jgi:hypothetical protein
MERDGLLSVLDVLGYEVTIGFDDRTNPNGACILLFADRRSAATG